MKFSRQEYWSGQPFSREFSRPGNQTQVSLIAGRSFTIWAIRETFLLSISTISVFTYKTDYKCFHMIAILIWSMRECTESCRNPMYWRKVAKFPRPPGICSPSSTGEFTCRTWSSTPGTKYLLMARIWNAGVSVLPGRVWYGGTIAILRGSEAWAPGLKCGFMKLEQTYIHLIPSLQDGGLQQKTETERGRWQLKVPRRKSEAGRWRDQLETSFNLRYRIYTTMQCFRAPRFPVSGKNLWGELRQ